MGLRIGQKMKNETSKFRVGFGGFSEKPVFPFSSRQHNPVNFLHYLDLTQDLSEFWRSVIWTIVQGVDKRDGMGGLE
jgi:hypothetical protein